MPRIIYLRRPAIEALQSLGLAQEVPALRDDELWAFNVSPALWGYFEARRYIDEGFNEFVIRQCKRRSVQAEGPKQYHIN